MGTHLAQAATDRQMLDDDGPDAPSRGPIEVISGVLKFPMAGRNRAMEQLGDRLDGSTADLMRRLIAAHGLVGESAKRIERELKDFHLRRGTALDERSGAVAGAVVSGALGGLAADVLAGGMTLGGGLIAGTILGALGGTALAKGYRLVGGGERPSVRWSAVFLDELFRQVVLNYLAVAHFGRGQGAFQDLERPDRWTQAVDAVISTHFATLHLLWKEAETTSSDDAAPLARKLAGIAESVADTVLSREYPVAAPSPGQIEPSRPE
jgi:hypothetical protein